MKGKWYIQTWFIALLAALWPLYVPAAIALYLLYLQNKENAKVIQLYGQAETLVSEATAKSEEMLAGASAEIKRVEEEVANKQSYLEQLKQTLVTAENDIKKLNAEYHALSIDVIAATANLPSYRDIPSEEYKNQLQLLILKQQELIKKGKAVDVTASDSKKTVDNNIKQLMRCFNAECENITGKVNARNLDQSRNKIAKTYETLNRIFVTDGVAISHEYLEMKLNEINLVYDYDLKKEQEREIQKAIREQMVEEEKVRREIEREKAKIAKEENQFKNEVSKLMKYMQGSTNEVEKQLYVDKIKELEEKLKLLEKDKENVLQREQNTRAGFVYVISNIGSFGENIYKIGMTRRLEPLDRIKELSDASVPFKFDLHALIFSEDAPALENSLHQTFRAKELNKINPRKEFFSVSIKEIEEVVKKNHNATVDFTEMPEAFEYRESQRLLTGVGEL